MTRILRAAAAAFGLSGLHLASALAQTSTPVPPAAASHVAGSFDPATLAASFVDPWFWVTLLATMIAGAAGGVAFELLTLQGNIELPHRPADDELTQDFPYARGRQLYDLGIVARLLLGGIAAVAAMFVLTPETTFQLLASGIIAGMAATAVLRSLQDRLVAALAVTEAAETREAAARQDAKVREATARFAEIKDRLVTVTNSPAGSRGMETAAGVPLPVDLGELAEVERLLAEAHGIHEGM
jgi:hypothetical protein